MKNLRCVRCFLLLLSILATQVHAIEYVYRAAVLEEGGPDQIFINGMRAPGNNLDLYRHVSDETNPDFVDETGYISTTTDLNMAVEQGSINHRPPQTGFWVYEIRAADASAIDVAAAWRNMTTRLSAGFRAGAYFPIYDNLLTRSAEVAYSHPIPNTDIRRAFFYPYADTSAPTITRNNPNYVERPAIATFTQVYFIEIPELVNACHAHS